MKLTDSLKLMLEAGWDPNAVWLDNPHITLVQHAGSWRNDYHDNTALELLLAHGANPGVWIIFPVREGDTVLTEAFFML